MHQLREDPVTGRWVVVNIKKRAGLSDYAPHPKSKSSKTCPFCPGNEAMTPPEIIAYREKGSLKGAEWKLRVVPNKFPALRIEESTDKASVGMYDKIGGFGAHEVIIENPEHEKEIPDLPVEQIVLILKAFRDRCLDLRNDSRIKYILLFKNYGADAGASLEHPHSQLIALPIIPSRVAGEVRGALKHHEYTHRCIYCDMLSQERSEKKFVIHEGPDFVAMTPFASRFPFESWILPKRHRANFDGIDDSEIQSLARILKDTLSKIKNTLKDPPYNLMIQTLPIYGKELESYHWHIEIIPHLTRVAGFELGTGFYLNQTPPEFAAEILRKG